MGAVAIGEIGLDRKNEAVDFGLQLEFFEEQLAIARETDLPAVIHCRGAFNELIQSIRNVSADSRQAASSTRFQGAPSWPKS